MLMKVVFSEKYKKLRLYGAFFLYLSMIVGGAIPGVRSDIGQFASGLILHTLAYSLIAFLLFSGLRANSAARALKTFLIVALMGALDEYIQSFFPYRNGNIGDWMVDMMAAAVTLSALICLRLTQAGQRLLG
jgi:VanZ family protein